jgi:hypothetical protein
MFKLTICARQIFEMRETTDELIRQLPREPSLLTFDHLRWQIVQGSTVR